MCSFLQEHLHSLLHTLVKALDQFCWTMFIVMAVSPLYLIVTTSIKATASTMLMLGSDVKVNKILLQIFITVNN